MATPTTGLVIMPACNEAASLPSFLEHFRACNHDNQAWDLLLIDDGSNDDTAVLAESLGCVVIRNEGNKGIGYSIRRGCAYAVEHGYEVIGTLDVDGQHDPRYLRQATNMLQVYDLVIGSRYHVDSEQRGTPLDRALLNISVSAQVSALTGLAIADPLSGFWVMRRRVARFLAEHIRQERYGVRLEGILKLHFLLRETGLAPTIGEFAHPAIYANGGACHLNRTYSPAHREERLERFGVHAHHILEIMHELQGTLGVGFWEQGVTHWKTRRALMYRPL